MNEIVKIIEVDHLAERPKDGRAFDMEAYELQLQQNKLRADDENMEESKDNEDWSDDSDDSRDIEDNGKHKKKDFAVSNFLLSVFNFSRLYVMILVIFWLVQFLP